MKFLVKFCVHADKREAVQKAFAQMTVEDDKRDMGNKIKLIGRWHDLGAGSGVAVCESDDAMTVAAWALNWNAFLDIETQLVLDDEEARAVILKRGEQQAEIKTTVLHN